MELLDHSFVAELPLKQRQAVCRQIRQRQVKKYMEFEKSDKGKEVECRKRNKGGNNVKFSTNYLLQDAVDLFDDRELYKHLSSGGDVNFVTGNGTSLLHRCATEDNVTAAQVLLTFGANIEQADDDWWTPLHTACSCDSVEVLQLLLKNGANIEALDVDGYYPVDLAPDGSESKSLMQQHQEYLGINDEMLHQSRQQRPQILLDHIRSLPLAEDVNALVEGGVTLMHIAAANGYRSCMKQLFKYNVDVNKKDTYGWTPLHVAARFNQTKAVELLLKQKANPNITDSLGSKPSALTNSDELRGLLTRHERRFEKKESDRPKQDEVAPVVMPSQDNIYDDVGVVDVAEDVADSMETNILRLNSKTVRSKRSSISKEDGWMEARTMYKAMEEFQKDDGQKTVAATIHPLVDVGTAADDGDEDEKEAGYISMAIWRAGAQEEHQMGKLVDWQPSDDLVTMAAITDEAILEELRVRYNSGQIYTYISGILIAVNPYQELHYYSKDISVKFHQSSPPTPLPPHIYGIAENSLIQMLRNKQSQCHVISGESGSGKTESCKHIVQHLLRVAESEEVNLNSKINQVNPLLEAFGNATTVMNANSSRFGKYVELTFTEDGKVLGGKISQYLLEKSRVVHQDVREGNFHIFYWMMAGLLPEETIVYKLQNIDKFRYLSGSQTPLLSAAALAENKAKFWEVKECLKFIGFSQSDIQNVLISLSIVLHLGEIRFTSAGNNQEATVSNLPILQRVSEMLDVSSKELRCALVADYTVTRGEQIRKDRTVYQAEECRDALAKSLYARLFAWIVNGINQLIKPQEQDSNVLQIGVLDIFGFENFQKNSFEQICINVTNEKIQAFTNENVFYNEQQDCLLEGVPLVELNYSSNLEILDLFLGQKMSILGILDEECSFPRATDKSLALKLHQNFGKKQNKYYTAPKGGGLQFTIAHYAGSVTYDVQGMLEKNRDTLPNSVLATVKASSSLLIKELFHSRVSRTGSIIPSARQQRRRQSSKKSSSPFDFFRKLKGRKEDKRAQHQVVQKKGPSTVAFHFRNSLNELLPKLQASQPHFVKCIKPNTDQVALTYDPVSVARQLKYTGISDIVRIRKYGYVSRLTFHEFLSRYDILVKCCLPQFCPRADEAKCREVLTFYNIKGVQFGRTKLFLRQETLTQLDVVTAAILQKVVLAQAAIRGVLARRQKKRLMVERQRSAGQFINSGLDDNHSEDLLKKIEIGKKPQELDTLDEVLKDYDTVDKPTTGTEYDEDGNDLYDEAFSRPPQSTSQNVNTIGSGSNLASEATHTTADMNGHLQRGLPPTPTHALHTDSSRPPPCPREMYAQGMYACIDGLEEAEARKQAPPPPKRNPETRLSTSVSSSCSATYEELLVEDQHQQHQLRHQQQQQHQQRHTTHGSPLMRSKFSHESQSPSHSASNRPFSYGAPVLPHQQPLKHSNGSHMNGNSTHQQSVLSNYQYSENHTASPAASYGKSESVFHPQPHRPPPHVPPPPPPQSPKMQRHSIPSLDGSPNRIRTPMSPQAARNNSGRSHSVTSVEEVPKQQMTQYFPPASHIGDGYSSSGEPYRPESPPLPPPPPELLANSYILQPEFSPNTAPASYHQSNQGLPASQAYQHQQYQQAPGNVSSAQAPSGLKSPGMLQSQQYQQYYQQQHAAQQQQQHQRGSPVRSANAPPPPPVSSIPKKDSPMAHPTMLNMGDNSNGIGRGNNQNSPGRSSNSPSSHASRETSPATNLIGELNKKQLRKTGLKPEEEVLPTPPEPSPQTPPTQQAEITPPQQEEEDQLVSPRDFINKFEKKAEQATKGDTSKNSKMEIDIDDIDLNEVPGYTPITKSTPIWKRDMIEKKNQEKIEEYIRKKQKEKEEAEKWKNVPAWKRKLMMEKEKEKESKVSEDTKKAREAEEQRRQRIREQQEMERQMEEELKDVPAWKREIMMKKGGAIKNWGDERADINDQEGGDQDGLSDGTDSGLPPPPPELLQQQQPNHYEQQSQKQTRPQQQPPRKQQQNQMKPAHKPTPPHSPALSSKQPPPQPPKQQQKQQKQEQPPKQQPPPQQPQKQPPPPKQQHQPKQQHHQQKPVQYSAGDNDHAPKVFVQKATMVLQSSHPQKSTPVPKEASPIRRSTDEQKLEEEWDNLPEWKKEIIMKKGGTIRNWGDEREEVNEVEYY